MLKEIALGIASRIIHGHIYGYLLITAREPHEKIFTSSSSDISSMNRRSLLSIISLILFKKLVNSI